MAIKMKKIRKPRMRTQMVYDEVAERTNLPSGTVERVMEAYREIIEESLINMVEVPLGTIGLFSFNVVPPHEHVEWKGFYSKQKVVYFKNNSDGYIDIKWRFGKNFKKRMKEKTKIPYGSMPSLPGSVELFPPSDIKIDYDEMIKQRTLEKHIEAEADVNQNNENINTNNETNIYENDINEEK